MKIRFEIHERQRRTAILWDDMFDNELFFFSPFFFFFIAMHHRAPVRALITGM